MTFQLFTLLKFLRLVWENGHVTSGTVGILMLYSRNSGRGDPENTAVPLEEYSFGRYFSGKLLVYWPLKCLPTRLCEMLLMALCEPFEFQIPFF